MSKTITELEKEFGYGREIECAKCGKMFVINDYRKYPHKLNSVQSSGYGWVGHFSQYKGRVTPSWGVAQPRARGMRRVGHMNFNECGNI